MVGKHSIHQLSRPPHGSSDTGQQPQCSDPCQACHGGSPCYHRGALRHGTSCCAQRWANLGSTDPPVRSNRGHDPSCPQSPAHSSSPCKSQKPRARAQSPYQRPPTGMSAPWKPVAPQLPKGNGALRPSAPPTREPRSPQLQDQFPVFTPSRAAKGEGAGGAN